MRAGSATEKTWTVLDAGEGDGEGGPAVGLGLLGDVLDVVAGELEDADLAGGAGRLLGRREGDGDLIGGAYDLEG